MSNKKKVSMTVLEVMESLDHFNSYELGQVFEYAGKLLQDRFMHLLK